MTEAKARTSKLAITSLVLAVITLLTAGLPLLIGAIICGHIALRAIKKSQGAIVGRGVAIAGLVISYGLLIAGAIWVPFLLKENNERVAAIKQAFAERERKTTQTTANAAPRKPLPPTRTEEMQQRIDAFLNRGGDPVAAELLDSNLSILKELEARAGEILAAYQALDVETVFRPDLANAEKINRAEAELARLQRAAVALKDYASVHRNTFMGSVSEKAGPAVATETADKTRDNYMKFIAWTDSAQAFAQPAQQMLRDFKATGRMDAQLVDSTYERAVEYEEIQEEIVTISAKQQAEFEKTMPR